MPDPAELHASSVDVPGPEILEAEVLDTATTPNREVRCVSPSIRLGRFTSDPCGWMPYVKPDGIYYPKKGDRALVSVHDGPDTIVFWQPAVDAEPDHAF